MEELDHDHTYGPGVVIGRRQLLRWSGLGAALALMPPLSGAQDAPPGGAGSFEAFATNWRSLTDRHLDRETPQEEAYMHLLAGSIAGLPLEALPRMQRKVFENERIASGPAFIDAEIFIVELQMQPGAFVAPHNHPDHIVATTCLEGSCHFRQFEARGAPGSDDHKTGFTVQETRRGRLVPGDTSHLSRRRDNIHCFQAGEKGAVLLDFTIERGDGTPFGMLDIAGEARDPFLGLYDARWTPVRF